MVFTTLCWKNASLLQLLHRLAQQCLSAVAAKKASLTLPRLHCHHLAALCCVLLAQLLLLPNAQAQEGRGAEIRQLQVKQSKDGLLLNASVSFKLGAALQDALAKGVPLHFVAQANVQRDRWYWWDEKVRLASRSMRLSYAPLTRRWRVAVQSNAANEAADINLNLSFASQEEALAAVRNIGSWRIADSSLLQPDERYNIAFRFYLDLSQLPRPFQIGLDAQSDWKIEAQANTRPVPAASAQPLPAP